MRQHQQQERASYAFDPAHRLNAVTGLQSYRYDALGCRAQTTDAKGMTTFGQYSQARRVLYASEARKSLNTDYIYLSNTQVATRHTAWRAVRSRWSTSTPMR